MGRGEKRWGGGEGEGEMIVVHFFTYMSETSMCCNDQCKASGSIKTFMTLIVSVRLARCPLYCDRKRNVPCTVTDSLMPLAVAL